MKFQVTLLIIIIREIISIFIFKITKFLANYQNPTDRDKYIDMVTNRRLILEYVNYYYNLYYIAFYRKITGCCTGNFCFYELKKQLMMILIIDSIYIIARLFYQIFHLRKNKKYFQRLMNKYQTNNKNGIPDLQDFSIKFKIYTREEFVEENIQKLIMPVIFHFGYVMQFGICYPISFLFLLIFTMFCRIAYSISLIYLFYVKTFEASKGLRYYNKMQNTIIYIGLFTNIGIICYTKKK